MAGDVCGDVDKWKRVQEVDSFVETVESPEAWKIGGRKVSGWDSLTLMGDSLFDSDDWPVNCNEATNKVDTNFVTRKLERITNRQIPEGWK